jgi:prolipoprotein diacylglyceryl transferase
MWRILNTFGKKSKISLHISHLKKISWHFVITKNISMSNLLAFVVHWNVEPELFNFHGFAPRWYSLAFLFGFMIGYYILQRIYIEDKAPIDTLDTLLLYLIIGTVFGARIGHCLFYEWHYFQNHLLEIFLPFQFEPTFQFTGFTGLASHGGAIGVLIAQWLYCKKVSKKPLIWLLDRIGIPIMLVACFIRLGNLMNSEIVGHASDLPWAFVFEKIDAIPRHPAQLYEAIAYFLIFIVMYNLYWKTNLKLKAGKLLGIFTVLLWTSRFFLEFFKREQGGLEDTLGLLSTGQWLSLPLILVGLYFWFRKTSGKA